MKCKKIKCLFLLVLLGLPFLFGCSKDVTPITKSGFYFDTIIQITLYDDSKEALIDECFALADQYEKLFSKTEPDSDISRINASLGEPVTVSAETVDLLTTALKYCALSDGSFDITIGALSDLWDISNNPGILPQESDIAQAISSIGYENISINGTQVTRTNLETQVDAGAIAKGYIADRMKEYLNEQGVCEGFINLGGNVLVLGPKEDGTPYRIGIQKPFADQGEVLLSVSITDGTVVSSGTYERFFQLDGVTYHHILNPTTGYPYENGLTSVTILCPNSVDGDALSTTCFSLGLEQGLALIESLPDTEAIFITSDMELVTSSGMGTTIPYDVMDAAAPDM